MFSKKYQWVLLPILCVLFLCTLILVFSFYQSKLKENLNETAFQTLDELLVQQKLNFTERVDADMKSIKNLAKMVRYLPDDQQAAVDLGASLVQNTNFDYLILANKNGKAISSNGMALNLEHRSYFQTALAGKTTLSQPRYSSINHSLVIALATPIVANQEVVGVLAAAYKQSDLAELLLPSYGGRAFAIITDSQGSVIYSPKQQNLVFYQNNLFDSISRATVLQYDGIEQIRAKTKTQQGGHTLLSLQGEKLLMQYAPLGINQWYIFMVAPESVISKQADPILADSALLTAFVFLFFLLITLYTLHLQKLNSKEKLTRLRELETVAYFDTLTGLPNIHNFKREGEALLLSHPDRQFFILKFDIHNFKIINELFGFEAGNQVLCALARFMAQISQEIKLFGSFARVTADEFIVLGEVNDCLASRKLSFAIFDIRLHDMLFHILGAHRIECRYGRYLLEPGECDINRVIEKVNLAHRVAKREKVNQVCDYDQSFQEIALQEAKIENRMDTALANHEFSVFLQPKFDIKSETVMGAEALVRWQQEDGTILPPSEFIPLFERNGFILKLDLYVFEQVCQLLQRCIQEHRTLLPISVNFSKLHLRNPNFVSKLASLTEQYSVPKEYIEIELTESTIFNNEEALGKLLHELHDVGFTLSMDDFGTGYSSLGLLKNLPVDVLKIDKLFFCDGYYKDRGRLVLESVIEMAKKLNMLTVAEGVEVKEDIEFLREVGCDIVQGYYFSRPIPSQEFFQQFTIVFK